MSPALSWVTQWRVSLKLADILRAAALACAGESMMAPRNQPNRWLTAARDTQELTFICDNGLCLMFQEVAVFVFDKKMIDKYQKFEKDQIVDSLKRGVQQLTRLRHPRLLTVQHPLEESRWITHWRSLSHSHTRILISWTNPGCSKWGLTFEENLA